MRPRAAMGVTQLAKPEMALPAPPPLKMTAPVSPSNPRSPPPRLHTTASAWPSVVVTIGEPLPPCCAHHATVGLGGLVALIFTAVRSPFCPPGHPAPFPLKTTYVPCAVV